MSGFYRVGCKTKYTMRRLLGKSGMCYIHATIESRHIAPHIGAFQGSAGHASPRHIAGLEYVANLIH
jgi:hypothetical protein